MDADTLSSVTGVDKSTAYRWLSGGSTPYRKYKAAISDAAGVSLEWLETGEGDRDAPGGESEPVGAGSAPAGTGTAARAYDTGGGTGAARSSALVLVPTAPYGHAASLDRTVDNTDAEERVTTYHEDTLRQMLGGDVPRDADGRVSLRLSFAVGDSMAPFIPDGAPFLFVPEATFVDGARYALWLGPSQADVIKRIEVLGGGVVHLVSDNPAVRRKVLRASPDEPEVFLDEDGETYDLTIRGRVVWPLDTPQAVVGQIADRLTEFAQRMLR